MKYDACKSLMIWGLSDDLTWRPGKAPLLFNSQLQKKPAYWGVHAALRQFAGEELPNAIEDVEADEVAKAAENYNIVNILGQRVNVMQKGNIYIINGNKYLCK